MCLLITWVTEFWLLLVHFEIISKAESGAFEVTFINIIAERERVSKLFWALAAARGRKEIGKEKNPRRELYFAARLGDWYGNAPHRDLIENIREI